MHLYGSTASPFVQRVLMAARVKGHELELRFPPGEGGMKSAEFREFNPLGRIPVLAFDDGGHLCESEAIAGYLDETLDGPSLLPGDALARARVREIVAVTTLEFATAIRPMMVHLVFRMGDAPMVIEAARRQAEKGLDALDRLIANDPSRGQRETLDAADCVLVPILTLAELIEPMTGVATLVRARAALSAYWSRIVDDPVARGTVDEMRAGFAAIMARNAPAG
ncbi:MAG: glutathione S-transferase family protein [Sphingomonas sp.]